MPCHPARARELLSKERAAIFRHYPFTIILKRQATVSVQPIELRLDPGSRTTGIALVSNDTVPWGAELVHRGHFVKKRLKERSIYRRSRRNRKCRYRKARFLNRRRSETKFGNYAGLTRVTKPSPFHDPERKRIPNAHLPATDRKKAGTKMRRRNRRKRPGWFTPSMRSRVENILTWVERLRKLVPITSVAVERVRFDMQAIMWKEDGQSAPEGVEYQQGTLQGYRVRKYLMEKFSRRCVYCGVKDVPLQVEHVVPRAVGGSDRISNLVISCERCNKKKGDRPIEVFLKRKPDLLKRIKARLRSPLKDAAAVNVTRNAVFSLLSNLDLPVFEGEGAVTQYNRSRADYPKTHWIDAACVHDPTLPVPRLDPTAPFLRVTAKGRGDRRAIKPDAFGFPRRKKATVSDPLSASNRRQRLGQWRKGAEGEKKDEDGYYSKRLGQPEARVHDSFPAVSWRVRKRLRERWNVKRLRAERNGTVPPPFHDPLTGRFEAPKKRYKTVPGLPGIRDGDLVRAVVPAVNEKGRAIKHSGVFIGLLSTRAKGNSHRVGKRDSVHARYIHFLQHGGGYEYGVGRWEKKEEKKDQAEAP